MHSEHERKFLVRSNLWKNYVVDSQKIQQSYLSTSPDIRLRTTIASDVVHYTLTLKSAVLGISRKEVEYAVSAEEAVVLTSMANNGKVSKTRYLLSDGWVVDVFANDNNQLTLAEVEVDDPSDSLVLPEWVGEEVTADPRFYNKYLAKLPYNDWEV